MYKSCLEKQQQLVKTFGKLDRDAKYNMIIELGKKLPKLDPAYKNAENLVRGCQSTMYLHAKLENDKVIFSAESDALISAGLAMLLIAVYSDERPETILKCPPDYLETMGIGTSLTPSRANGLYSMHLRMKQEAVKLLSKQSP